MCVLMNFVPGKSMGLVQQLRSASCSVKMSSRDPPERRSAVVVSGVLWYEGRGYPPGTVVVKLGGSRGRGHVANSVCSADMLRCRS